MSYGTSHSPSIMGKSRLMRTKPMLALVAMLALVFSVLPAMQAHAADTPDAGYYEGPSTAWTGASVSFNISDSGQLTEFNTESYIQCGLYPTPMTWTGVPTTQMTVSQPLNLTWDFGEVSYNLEGFVINEDGTASGEGYAAMPGCQGYRFDFTASNTGGSGPGPEPQVPTVILEKDAYYDYEIQRVGIMIRGVGFPADTDVAIAIDRVINDEEQYSTVVRSDANGVVYDRYVGWLEHQPLSRAHSVTLTAEADGQTFTDAETFNARPGGDGSFQYFDAREMVVDPQSVTQAELGTDGIRIESDDMDGREDTAELLINGELIAEVPVVEIADEFGEVDFDFTHGTLPVGEHEAALRTVHVSGSMNPVTWERVAWETFTVTEDPVYDPEAAANPTSLTESELTDSGVTITGEGFAPNQVVTLSVDSDEVETRDSDNSGDVSFTYTGPLGPGSYEAELSSAAGDATASFTVTQDPDPEPVEVVAEAPARVDNTVTIPVVEGVTYVDGAENVLTGDVVLTEGETLVVTAVAEDGYVLADGPSEWSFTYEADDPEPVEVVAEAPTRVDNTVTIPVVEGVTYVDGDENVLTGDVVLTEGEPLVVTAVAEDGYVLADGPSE